MSRAGFFIVPFIFIIILSVFFFLSPNFFKTKVDTSTTATEIMTKRFLSLGNTIAHASFVKDAIVMNLPFNLDEIINQARRDDPEITYLHFTDGEGKVISSSDANMVDKIYSSQILGDKESVIKENKGIYEGGFIVKLGAKKIGALYLGARPRIPKMEVSNKPKPIILGIGIIVAIIASFITFSMAHGYEAKLVENINKRQEEVFSPKVEVLKKEEAEAAKKLENLNKKINDGKRNLQKLNNDYAARKKEIASNPVVQSVEKLKATESEKLKRLEELKNEEARLNNEITLLTQKREEIGGALEAEKKEESALHERLDLIKKKILHLETPGK